VEPLGDRYIYDLQVGRYVVKVKASPSLILDAGQPIGIEGDPDHLHLFDAATQNRLPLAQAGALQTRLAAPPAGSPAAGAEGLAPAVQRSGSATDG
jgi:hypothetical protein